MKVLIIGSKGMLGQDLVRAFGDRGLDADQSSARTADRTRIDWEVLGWDREEIDITSPDVAGKISAAAPDLLINSAAYNAVDKIEEEEEKARTINGLAVGVMADICSMMGIPMVHYSTDYVFDGENREGYSEHDAPNPQSAYARSKRTGETALMNATDSYWLMRTSRLFGRPASAPGAKKSFPDVMLDLAKTKKEFDLVDEEVSCPTYSLDLARRTREIVEAKKPYGIYHATNAGGCTWFEFGKAVFEIAGADVVCRPVPGSAYPRPAKRPAFSVLKSTKMPAMRPWREALAVYLGSRY